MTKSIENSSAEEDKWDFELDLPRGDGYREEKTEMSAKLMAELSEKRLPLINGSQSSEEDRLKGKARKIFEI